MRIGWRVAVVWGCLLVRLAFYSAMLPLWEGYDEWAHFAVIRIMATHGAALVPRDAPIPRDVEASLQLAPVPWEMRYLQAPSATQDVYWRLPAEERARRQAALLDMPAEWRQQSGSPAFTAYEALQPPLYYWAMAPALRLLSGWTLASQVLALRWLSSLLASLAVPLVFLLGQLACDDARAGLGCAAVVAVMPGFALDVARVGNDCLAVVLFTLLTCLTVRIARGGTDYRLAVCTGLALGLGLLTKAYFLTAILGMALVLAYRWWRSPGNRGAVVLHAVVIAALSAALAGWWYLRNLRTTGTLAGLSESVMLRHTGTAQLLGQAAGIHWARAIDAIVFSHLYFGGWSSLTVRSWMYHVFYLAILLAALGLFRLIPQPSIGALLAIYLAFWLGQLYNVLLLFASKGLGGSMGWYMYAVVGAETVLTVAGLQRMLPPRLAVWAAAAGAGLFALLDLYTVHGVAIPYYTGMIRHRANNTLEALHWSALQNLGPGGAMERLAALVPAALLLALWLLYLAGTAGAVASAAAGKRHRGVKTPV